MPTPDYSTAAVSVALDALSDEVGTILIRTPEGWRALPPGPEGYVLTSRGPDQPPEWAPPT